MTHQTFFIIIILVMVTCDTIVIILKHRNHAHITWQILSIKTVYVLTAPRTTHSCFSSLLRPPYSRDKTVLKLGQLVTLKWSLSVQVKGRVTHNSFKPKKKKKDRPKARPLVPASQVVTAKEIFFFFLFKIFQCTWLYQVLVVAHGLSCPMACLILVSWPGTEPASSAWKQILYHCTTWEVLGNVLEGN